MGFLCCIFSQFMLDVQVFTAAALEESERMYRVAICEDERCQLNALCNLCQEILTRKEVMHEVIPFSSAKELAEALEEGEQFDLLCLDILMTEKSGMELATELREWDDQTSILFITCSTDHLLEGYSVRPIQYLLKPVRQEALEKAIQTDLRIKYRQRTITLNAKGKTTVLPLDGIRYVESRNHGCVFFMESDELFFPISLAQTQSLLPPSQFSRCHNSFVVNLAQIREASSREVVLLSGERLTIGRRYAQQFYSDFVRYLNQTAR